MQSKERVQNALNHRQPDKVPIDFNATAVSGMHVSCVDALRGYFGLEKRPVKVHEPYQMLGQIDEDLMEVLGIDCAGVSAPNTMFGFPNKNYREWRMPNGLVVLVSEQFQTTQDEAGSTFIYPCGDKSAPPSGRMPKDGYFFDAIMRQEPIDDDKLNPEDNLEEFQLLTEEELAGFKTSIDAQAKSGRAVVVSMGGTALGDIALVPAPFMKHPKGIRDVEEWYVSTVLRRDYIEEVFARQTDIAVQNLEKLNQVAGDAIDVLVLCGTDFGTQIGTFLSQDTFRDLYLPYYQKMTRWIHENTAWKTFKHSCGAVASMIPLLLEAGFDILNPVQCSAVGMEPEGLKDTYGDRIVFWGGGVDTQKILPFGTPEEVREQVLRRCEIFSRGGGFVFNAIHNVQAQTPIENIVAMLRAVHEFNGDGQRYL